MAFWIRFVFSKLGVILFCQIERSLAGPEREFLCKLQKLKDDDNCWSQMAIKEEVKKVAKESRILHDLDRFGCPRDKLSFLYQEISLIVDHLTEMGKSFLHCLLMTGCDDTKLMMEDFLKTEGPNFGTDNLLPVLICLATEASIKTFESNLQFMANFVLSGSICGEHQFCLALFDSLVNYIRTL